MTGSYILKDLTSLGKLGLSIQCFREGNYTLAFLLLDTSFISTEHPSKVSVSNLNSYLIKVCSYLSFLKLIYFERQRAREHKGKRERGRENLFF